MFYISQTNCQSDPIGPTAGSKMFFRSTNFLIILILNLRIVYMGLFVVFYLYIITVVGTSIRRTSCHMNRLRTHPTHNSKHKYYKYLSTEDALCTYLLLLQSTIYYYYNLLRWYTTVFNQNIAMRKKHEN